MNRAVVLLSVLCSTLIASECTPTPKEFIKIYPFAYQDIMVQNTVIQEGSQLCDLRYEMIKPILNAYDRPFSVLDIGAYEGYFSFKIAEEYPHACVVPLEGGYYPEAAEKLNILCRMNAHLKNLNFLHHSLTLEDLKKLKMKEHFDVILALLVIHQIAEKQDARNLSYMERIQDCIDDLFQLGNDVIIEVSLPDVYPEVAVYVDKLCQKKKGIYLGQVYRTKSPNPAYCGKLYWFKNSSLHRKQNLGITLEVFRAFGGRFPDRQEVEKAAQRFPKVQPSDLIVRGETVEPIENQ